MEYQKITNSLHNKPNQPTKFKTKNWVEIYDDARRTHNTIVKLNLKLHC